MRVLCRGHYMGGTTTPRSLHQALTTPTSPVLPQQGLCAESPCPWHLLAHVQFLLCAFQALDGHLPSRQGSHQIRPRCVLFHTPSRRRPPVGSGSRSVVRRNFVFVGVGQKIFHFAKPKFVVVPSNVVASSHPHARPAALLTQHATSSRRRRRNRYI